MKMNKLNKLLRKPKKLRWKRKSLKKNGSNWWQKQGNLETLKTFLKLDWSRNKWLNKKKRSKRCLKLIPLYKSKKIKLPLEPIFKRILRYLLVNTTMNGGIQSMMTLYMTSSSRKPNKLCLFGAKKIILHLEPTNLLYFKKFM